MRMVVTTSCRDNVVTLSEPWISYGGGSPYIIADIKCVYVQTHAQEKHLMILDIGGISPFISESLSLFTSSHAALGAHA